MPLVSSAYVLGQLEHDASPQKTGNEPKHHASIPLCPNQGQPEHDAEQLQSKMQGKVMVEESLHDALAEGTRIDTPVGLATVRVVRYFENLEVPRWRCAVRTDTVQPNGSRFAVFDVC